MLAMQDGDCFIQHRHFRIASDPANARASAVAFGGAKQALPRETTSPMSIRAIGSGLYAIKNADTVARIGVLISQVWVPKNLAGWLPATSTAAATAATATATAARTTAAGLFLCFVNLKRTATHVLTVQALDCTGRIGTRHFDETETAWAAGVAIVN
jgi:hypothetical protein